MIKSNQSENAAIQIQKQKCFELNQLDGQLSQHFFRRIK
jgi:hypothetical protein